MRLGRILTGLSFLASSTPLAAQVIKGTVVLRDSTPVAGVIVLADDDRGTTAGRTLTNARGEFVLTLPSAGRYGLRVLRIGYRPTQRPSVVIAAGATEAVRIVFAAEIVTLTAVNVRDRETCRVSADTGLMVARVWEEARKAMLTSQLTSADAPLFAEWIEYDRTLDSTARMVRAQHVHTSRNPTTHAFRGRSAALLDSLGYVVTGDSGTMYYAPDADVLLSESFAARHCFRLEAPPRGSAGLIGVGFMPARDRSDVREIDGTLWLDRESAELRALEFHYTNLSDVAESAHPGGRVEFLRLRDGQWLVSRWSVRMPELAAAPRRSNNGLGRIVVSGTSTIVRSLHVSGGEVTRVTRHDSLVYEATGPHIAVQVVSLDTLVDVAGATLSLEGTDYTAIADASGRMQVAPVLAGRYRANVHTALMDSLGMPAVSQEIETRNDAHVDSLRLPRPHDLLRRVCPRDSIDHGEGMLRGSVRNERAMAITQAAVVVTWQTNFAIIGSADADHMSYNEKSIGTYSDSVGQWRVCGVPRDVPLVVSVLSDSGSDMRRARLMDDFSAVDLVARHDAVSAPRLLGVTGRIDTRARALVEIAVYSLQGAPLADATLEIRSPSGGTRTVVTGPSGRALLPDVAPGLLTIKARRIGFKQGQLAVTVEAGRNTVPIILSDVSMPTLDTVRIVGGQRATAKLDEFETRRLNHSATVTITRDEIVKRNPVDLWQMLMHIPSIRVTDSDTMTAITSTRAQVQNFGGQPCFIPIMVDGVVLNRDPAHNSFNANTLPRPEEVHGIEIFAGPASIPLRYGGLGGEGKWCGLIAIWTR